MTVIAPEDLSVRLAKGKRDPVILLLGADAYLREDCGAQIIEAWVEPAAREWCLSRFSAGDDDLGRILGQARMVPMLARQQVVLVRELDAIEKSSEADRAVAVEELDAYVEDPPTFTVLVLQAAALDQRTKLAKLLAAKALVVETALPQDPEQRARYAAAVAARIARERSASIDPGAAEELADLCNADLAAMRTEIDKLSTYVGSSRPIGRADVEALVVSEKKYSVWELAEMLASRQRGRAMIFLDNLLREGEPAPALVGAMAWMYRKLLEAQELGPHAFPGQAAGQLGMRRSTAEMALRQARRIPRRRLVEGLRALYDADSRVKSGSVNSRAVLEFLVAGLVGPVSESGGSDYQKGA
jgi:DNA polymerase III subunit delta